MFWTRWVIAKRLAKGGTKTNGRARLIQMESRVGIDNGP
jgi:hypothetical protein